MNVIIQENNNICITGLTKDELTQLYYDVGDVGGHMSDETDPVLYKICKSIQKKLEEQLNA